MKSLAMILLITIVSFFPQTSFTDSWNKRDHLFRIERSINKNFVQFDARLMENTNLLDVNPVIGYWVLENGQQQELTQIQQKYAYGIHSQQKLEKNKFKILLVALKDREVIVEKIGEAYRAVTTVNGITSVLEKVYVKSKENLMGFQKVIYIDLFGRVKDTGLPVNERIISSQ
jgi:hypothetical protein